MILVENLSAAYESTPKGQTVIKDISFDLPEGKIMGLLGRNGCGKTTLFRCMNGLLKPSTGRVVLDGKDISKLSQQEIARTAALVPQATATAFSLTVRDMILLGANCRLKAWQSPSIELMDEAYLHAKEVHMDAYFDCQFNELSGGEQQLVLMARALMQNTKILFLDEPTSHLDFTNRYMIMDMVRELSKKKNMTVIITAHDPNIVLEYCTDVLMIKDRQRFAFGTVSEVMTEENLKALYGECISLENTGMGQVVMPSQRSSNDL